MLTSRVVNVVLLLAIAWPPSSDRLETFATALVFRPFTENQSSMMINRAADFKSPSIFAPYVTLAHSSDKKNAIRHSRLHSSVVSPRRAEMGGGIDDDNIDNDDSEREISEEKLRKEQGKLTQLINTLEAEPRDLLRFGIEDSSGVRGMYLNRSIRNGEIVLKLPVDSCLSDDQCPVWLHDEVKNDPHRWATRLAASWIDMHLKDQDPNVAKTITDTSKHHDNYEGHKIWSSLLPDSEYLRASLPVHWPESTILNARSTALELAVDSAFFSRAEAVNDLVRGMQHSPYVGMFDDEDEVKKHTLMNELAHHALDLVQTRSCRLEDESGNCRRVLAPIFDFINHGSKNTASANAYFVLEEEQDVPSNSKKEYLVVRSTQDISEGEEVKIDYGASARPAWKCLLSYGFVPDYKRTTNDAEEGENLAEVYMKGVRYEVADDSVPIDMVADATPGPWIDEEDNEQQSNESVLTPEIALRIAERITDVAYQLLLEPEQIVDENENNLEEDPFDIISKQLAASLRWSQHRILLTCAAGLTHFAKENTKEQESTYQKSSESIN